MKSYLSEEEIIALTGYQQPERQIKVLRSRGFTRVFRGPKGNVESPRVSWRPVGLSQTGVTA
jgi:hypothetical protein